MIHHDRLPPFWIFSFIFIPGLVFFMLGGIFQVTVIHPHSLLLVGNRGGGLALPLLSKVLLVSNFCAIFCLTYILSLSSEISDIVIFSSSIMPKRFVFLFYLLYSNRSQNLCVFFSFFFLHINIFRFSSFIRFLLSLSVFFLWFSFFFTSFFGIY